MSADQYVIDNGKDYHTSVHDNVPVHCICCDYRTLREKGEEPDNEEKSQSDAIDEESIRSQTPSARWKNFAAKAFND